MLILGEDLWTPDFPGRPRAPHSDLKGSGLPCNVDAHNAESLSCNPCPAKGKSSERATLEKEQARSQHRNLSHIKPPRKLIIKDFNSLRIFPYMNYVFKKVDKLNFTSAKNCFQSGHPQNQNRSRATLRLPPGGMTFMDRKRKVMYRKAKWGREIAGFHTAWHLPYLKRVSKVDHLWGPENQLLWLSETQVLITVGYSLFTHPLRLQFTKYRETFRLNLEYSRRQL